MTSRRWIVAAAAFLVAPVLAGCSAGFDANTNKPYALTEAGALIVQGKYGTRGIDIPQAFVLGPDSGSQIPWRGSAPVYLNILNTRAAPDSLQSVSAGNVATVKLAAPIRIPSNQLVNTGKPTPQIVLEGISTSLRGGESIHLDLQFANAGNIAVDVPVVTRSREYKDYPPASEATPPAGTPSPTPTASAPPTAG